MAPTMTAPIALAQFTLGFGGAVTMTTLMTTGVFECFTKWSCRSVLVVR